MPRMGGLSENDSAAVAGRQRAAPKPTSVQKNRYRDHLALSRSAPADESVSTGRRLEPSLRFRLERGLGVGIPDIRLHTDDDAALLANCESERAVTHRNDIAFASGEYRPGTFDGDGLLAHEAAHVVQQSRGSGALSDSQAESSAERASVTALLRWNGPPLLLPICPATGWHYVDAREPTTCSGRWTVRYRGQPRSAVTFIEWIDCSGGW